MPFQPIVPTWTAWNNANFTSPTAMADPITGQQYASGGLNLGDYFDATNQEAASASYTTNGLLFEGRYRYVNVDSGATAANVKTGTVGYLRAGSSVVGVVITTAGSNQNNGTYTIAATGGGGTGAQIQITIAYGSITVATVLTGGVGYTSVPTFTIGQGGVTGVVAAQLSSTANVVTSYDQTVVTGVRSVVFLNSITPGNYGFVQELGLATVLGAASGSNTALPAFVNANINGSGLVTTAAAGNSNSPTGYTIGQAVDTPQNANLFKIYMQYVPVVQD
jgi:hypothetical protein